jgi:chaperonin GroES
VIEGRQTAIPQSLHDRLLVRRIEEKEVVNGQCRIPRTAKQRPRKGEVLAVVGGVDPHSRSTFVLDVRVGDRILFGKYSGREVVVSGEELLLLSEDEFLVLL